MPYHLAISIAMGGKCPDCTDEDHWFTVYPSGEGAYVCQCRRVEMQHKGFRFLNKFDLKTT